MYNLGIPYEISDKFISGEKQTTVDVMRREEAQQEGLQGGQRKPKCSLLSLSKITPLEFAVVQQGRCYLQVLQISFFSFCDVDSKRVQMHVICLF